MTFAGQVLNTLVVGRSLSIFSRAWRFAAWGNTRCRACAEMAEGNGRANPALCADCAKQLAARRAGYCQTCGKLFPNADTPVSQCADCLQEPPPWAGFYMYAAYEGLLRELFTGFKFYGDLAAGRLLAQLLCSRVSPCLGQDIGPEHGTPPWLVPVPVHQTRLQERGFNQSLLLSRPLARALGLRLAPQALCRTRLDPPQSTLGRKERLHSPKGAFAAHPGVKGRTVVLLDDVMTTGATMREASRVLLSRGAAEVRLVILARTPFSSGL